MKLFMLASCLLVAAVLEARAGRHSGTFDADEHRFVIDQVLAALRESYVSEEAALGIEAEIRAREQAGDYGRLTSAVQFAEALTRDLQAASGDKHLVVAVTTETVEPRGSNCQFVNVAVLGGNVGYVKFDAFASPGKCAETAAAAMTLVADCDALIFDLRDNRGGDPAMVAFMASYLFADAVHLDNVYERRADAAFESWTLPFVPGRRFVGKPVFVITSPRTFSAAEGFSYDLQMLKRAVIVGEPSGGGAHLAVSRSVGRHFQVSVPVARYINWRSRTNWEGKGVQPDVPAREASAVQVAYRAALQEVIQKAATTKQRDAIQRQIDSLTGVINGLQ